MEHRKIQALYTGEELQIFRTAAADGTEFETSKLKAVSALIELI